MSWDATNLSRGVRHTAEEIISGGWGAKRDVQTYSDAEMTVFALIAVYDQLKTLNRVFACPNFLAVPGRLTAIEKNTRKPRRKAAKKR